MTVPPAYGAPPAGFPPGHPQPPQKKGFFTLPRVLLIVGLVAVLCCGGVAFGGYKLFGTVKDALTPARDAAVAFLTEVEQGDIADAYAMFCDDMQQTFTPEQFAAGVDRQGRITGHKITGISVNNRNGVVTGDVTAVLTREDGSTTQTTILLRKENGVWKICGNPF